MLIISISAKKLCFPFLNTFISEGMPANIEITTRKVIAIVSTKFKCEYVAISYILSELLKMAKYYKPFKKIMTSQHFIRLSNK